MSYGWGNRWRYPYDVWLMAAAHSVDPVDADTNALTLAVRTQR